MGKSVPGAVPVDMEDGANLYALYVYMLGAELNHRDDRFRSRVPQSSMLLVALMELIFYLALYSILA